MKVGDRVVCIINSPWKDVDTGVIGVGPIYNDVYTIDGFSPRKSGFISVKEIPELGSDGLRKHWNIIYFRKLQGTNKLSQELAHKVTWEEMIINPGLQEQELNPRIFTTKEKF